MVFLTRAVMNSSIYFKGAWHSLDSGSLPFVNGGLFFGESLFTSLCSVDGRFIYWDQHRERLRKGLEFLYGADSISILKELDEGMAEALMGKDYYYYRLTFFKALDRVEFFIYRKELLGALHQFSSVKVTCSEYRKAPTVLPSFLKLGQYASTNFELKLAAEKGFDDIVFLDLEGHVAEASKSNIFYTKNDIFYTPPTSSMVLGGIMRAAVIDCLRSRGKVVKEELFKIDDIISSDAAFLTNAVRGIIPISQLENKFFVENVLLFNNLRDWVLEELENG